MWLRAVLLICALAFVAESRVRNLQDLDVSRISEAIKRWALSEEQTQYFQDAMEILRLPTELQRADWRTFSGGREAAMCTICQSVIKTFMGLRRSGMSDSDIQNKVSKLCYVLNVHTEAVCRGAVDMHAPIMFYIMDQRPNITEETVCGVLLESEHCPLNDPDYEWTITINENPRVPIRENENQGSTKIVQITDLHYDPIYEPYGTANCREPTCCRKGQNPTKGTKVQAGFWGDYNFCDSPWHAVVDVLDHIKEKHRDMSYLYFTGDIIDHGVWETTHQGNVESLNKSYKQIYETFKGLPVFPTLGNHEPHPLNQFAPREIVRADLETNWLYELIAEIWIGFGWLPESTRSTILQGGFYTVSPRKGFRVVVLNSNVCYCYNWWIWYQPRDPDNQLQWLADTLFEAEKNQEFVHILSHIPAGHRDCLGVWRREFLRIVSRFSHIITGQFNGHTHNDELEVLYDEENIPSNVAWNGGSTTAYTNLNPNYKVYEISGSNFAVKDYDNWMYNLTEANENAHIRPRWYKSYSFKQEYGISEISAQSINDWIIRGANDIDVLTTYHKHFFKQAEPSLKKACNKNCKKQYFCRMITTLHKSEKQSYCNEILG